MSDYPNQELRGGLGDNWETNGSSKCFNLYMGLICKFVSGLDIKGRVLLWYSLDDH